MIAAWEQIGSAVLASLAVCALAGTVTFLVTWGRVRAHNEQQGKAINLLFEKVNEHGEQLARVETNVEWLVKQNGGTPEEKGGN